MTDSEEDYEEIRRRKAEERRQKREADRQKRRQRSTSMIRRDWSSASASAGSSASTSASTSVQSSVTKGTGANKSAGGFVSSNKSNTCILNEYKSDSRTRIISSSTKASTSISSTARSRTVAPPSASKSTLASASGSNGRDDRQSRIEKLKEKKRAEEGMRLIQEMYGTTYMNDKDLMRDDDDDDDDDDDSDGRNNHGKRTNVTKDKGKGQGKGKAVMYSNSPNQKDYVYKNSPRNNYVASSIMSKVQSDPTAWTSTKSKSTSASAFISKSNSKLSPPKSSTPTPPSVRTYTYKQNQYNNDSSSDDDLVALATNLQKQKESQSQSRLLSRVRSRSTSAPISTSVSSTSKSKSKSKSKSMVLSPKEGSGLSEMPTARRKGKDLDESTRHVDQGDTHGDSSDSGGDGSCKNIMLSSKKRRSDYISDDDDDDDGDDFDLMSYSRKIKRKRSGKHTPEKEECPDQEMSMSTPGNRNRDDSMDGVNVAAVKHFPAVDLWSSDSDQDQGKEVGVQSARMRRRKNGKLTAEGDSDDDDDDDDDFATNHKSENVKRGEAGSKRRGRKIRTESFSDKRKYQRSFLELESDAEEFELDDDDSALEKQLKPTFENPKWLNELVPFSLPKSVDSQDENGGTPVLDQVPAAINRYLKDYQQEGVRFLHSLVTRGLGAVLGDDMGKWFIIFCCVFLSVECWSVRSTLSPYHYIVQTCNCAIFVL